MPALAGVGTRCTLVRVGGGCLVLCGWVSVKGGSVTLHILNKQAIILDHCEKVLSEIRIPVNLFAC